MKICKNPKHLPVLVAFALAFLAGSQQSATFSRQSPPERKQLTGAQPIADGSKQGAASPTGRAPKFLWSRQWQAGWNKARKESHAWYALIKSNADRTGTSNELYNDYGQWCALVYQITGERAYGEKAVAKVLPLVTPANANYVREFYIEAVILYDWLLPAMTAQQKVDYEARLNKLAEYSLGINQPVYTGGFRLDDSDQTVGQYFGLALTDLALGTDYLSQSSQAGHLPKTPLGGLDTSDGTATVRNTIASYFAKANGGQWIESTGYNLGTNKLLLMGVGAIRTATGQEHFPEAVEYFVALKQSLLADLTPDLSDSFQWGGRGTPAQPRYVPPRGADDRLGPARHLGRNGLAVARILLYDAL